jgi:acyl transferase domain-containing protein
MMSVSLPQSEVSNYMGKSDTLHHPSSITTACINSPQNITLSGSELEIDKLKKQLDHDGIFARKISTGVAYHSAAMTEISDQYRLAIGKLYSGESLTHDTIMVSSVTGESLLDLGILRTSDYWVQNMIQ